MAIQIEVMYAQPDLPGNRHLTRKRVDVRFAHTLQADNVLHLILSATTTAALSRNKVDGVDKERLAEWSPVKFGSVTQDSCVLYRRGNDFALGAPGEREFFWHAESDPFPLLENKHRETNPATDSDEAVYFYAGYTTPDIRLHGKTVFDADMY